MEILIPLKFLCFLAAALISPNLAGLGASEELISTSPSWPGTELAPPPVALWQPVPERWFGSVPEGADPAFEAALAEALMPPGPGVSPASPAGPRWPEALGYGSYLMRVDSLRPGLYGLALKETHMASRLWWWEQDPAGRWSRTLLGRNGTWGSRPEDATPWSFPLWVPWQPRAGRGWFVLEQSNYIDPGRIAPPLPEAGSWSNLDIRRKGADLFRFLISGVLLFLVLHYAFFFSQRRQESSALWLAVFAGVLLLRHMASERFIPAFLPDAGGFWPYHLLMLVEVGCMNLASPIFATYVRRLYPLETPPWWPRVLWGLHSLSTLLVAFTPLTVYYHLIFPSQVLILINGVVMIVVLAQAWQRKRPGAGLALSGFVLFFVTIVQDILHFMHVIDTFYTITYGFLFFLASHTFVLTRAYTAAFATIETLNASLYRFVPWEFISKLNKASILDVKPGDHHKQNMTVLVSDIRNFTPLAETLDPHVTFHMLNEYYSLIGPLIRKHGGYIDKYLGDGILALFPDEPERALRAGLELRRALEVFNQLNKDRFPTLDAGLALHGGLILMGTLGESQRIDGTVIADTVNTAYRIEAKTKDLGYRFLVSRLIWDRIPVNQRPEHLDLGIHHLKGKTEGMGLVAVLCEPEESAAGLCHDNF